MLAEADAIAIYLGMHTATRIALEALPRLRQLAPNKAALAAFGLYAPMNETLLRGLGVTAIFGGESEPDLVAWAKALREGNSSTLAQATIVRHDKIEFLTPDRTDLPPLVRYAHLGCRMALPVFQALWIVRAAVNTCAVTARWCRYEGKFRVVPVEVVMADIAQQIEAGAQHISFGDRRFSEWPHPCLERGARLARTLAASALRRQRSKYSI